MTAPKSNKTSQSNKRLKPNNRPKLQQNYKRLRLILGDQLNASHSWYKKLDEQTLYIIAELPQEASYIQHHIQKACAFFCAMEHFANALSHAGHDVLYLTLDDTQHHKDLMALLQSVCQKYSISEFEYQQPDEYRLDEQLANFERLSGENTGGKKLCTTRSSTEHFLLEHGELAKLIKPAHHNRMEVFYRKMRKRFNILMDGEKPAGGQWNYDADNRNKLKPADIAKVPEPLVFSHDITAYKKRLEKHQIKTIGVAGDTLIWPVSRQQSLQVLEYFCTHCLPLFGRFQDAMTAQTPHKWSLYHSRLSFALNSKMLSPRLVIDKVLNAYDKANGQITLAQVEGFIRQILGWREYVRAVYWVNMPNYLAQNYLKASAPLPNYFWTGKTKMKCMQQALQQSLDYAYAHHIQRLMITGNFCTLFGINPDEVDAWYLGVYIDAIEWVELPNTRGMSQFADGGWVATKPYIASGNYVNKMSDYCKNCYYDVKQKTTENACPFNSMYWHFLDRHSEVFSNNPRIGMAYKTWQKQESTQQQALLKRAQWCLNHMDEL